MASRATRPAAGRSDHVSFLRYAGMRWLKLALLLCLACLVGYFLADVTPRPNGGSWYGYIMGTLGALLIVWLALLGVRKRAMTAGSWSLKAWTSAHVYLGLSLIVIATLHTGFQLGWNVHTLAYALMMLVILSGIYGISVYATLPNALSSNRREMTQLQMLEGLRAIDRQLDEAAQTLDQGHAEFVRAALEQSPFAGNIVSRLAGRYARCATQAAIDAFAEAGPETVAAATNERISGLLAKRSSLLAMIRRHMRLKAMLEIWLFIHVPATFALLAALSAHIISVFYYW